MPNLLLFGCSGTLVNKLRLDPAWSIGLALHSDALQGLKPTASPPDTTHWDIIVDDCGRNTSAEAYAIANDAGLPIYSISDRYLDESDRAHILRCCQYVPHLQYAFRGPAGERHLIVRPTTEPEALHMSEFVDLFEDDFVNGKVNRHTYSGRSIDFPRTSAVLFENYYDNPVVVLDRTQPSWLWLPDILDNSRRDLALVHMIERTAGRLWPAIWADTYSPRRAVALEAELDRLISTTRQSRRELEDAIHQSRAAFAKYAALTRLQGDALKNLVTDVFREVLDFNVTDLDAQLDPSEEKRLDLLLEARGLCAIVEVRGSATRNAQVERDLDRFVTNLRRTKLPPELNARVLVFNGISGEAMDRRRGVSTFSATVISEAKDKSMCVVSTYQLLQLIEEYWEGVVTKEAVVQALTQSGLFALTPDFGQGRRPVNEP